MRSFLLLSLAFLIGVAPVAIVPTNAKVVAKAAEKEEDDAEDQDAAVPETAVPQTAVPQAAVPDEETTSEPAKESSRKAPSKTLLIKLTPNQHPGSGHSIDQEDCDSSLLPDWPPALYARRLPMATVPPAPSADPALSSEMRAGHLNLPPPAA
jgi:hypothetical protein